MLNNDMPKPNLKDYPLPSPNPGVSTWLLSVLVVVGLIALFIAALDAFAQIMEWYQAVFAALLIEMGLVIEAMAFIRKKSILALCGLVISVSVSLTYNYIQASVAGAEIISDVELIALAVGPLSALVFVALTLGNELKQHETAVGRWQHKRQIWFDEQMDKYQKAIERMRKYTMKLNRSQAVRNRSENVQDSRSQAVHKQHSKRSSTGDGTAVNGGSTIGIVKVPIEQAERLLIAFYRDNPGGSYAQAGRASTYSKTWAAGKVAEMLKDGRLSKKDDGKITAANGHIVGA